MEVNIKIRIEDSENPENAYEDFYEGCPTETVLSDKELKLLHPAIKKFLVMFYKT